MSFRIEDAKTWLPFLLAFISILVSLAAILRFALMKWLGGPEKYHWFILKITFRLQVIVTACFSISDVLLDWSSFSSFLTTGLLVFAGMTLFLLMVPPLLCYAFERLSEVAKLNPLAYVLQIHMMAGAYESIRLGRKVFGMVWAAICEISLEAYYNTMLQSYAVLIAPELFLEKGYSYVIIHISVLMALTNMGKVLALDLDFFGQDRPQHHAHDDTQSFIWMGDSKSSEMFPVIVLRVMDYGYEVAVERVYPCDPGVLSARVTLMGGSFGPFVVKTCNEDFPFSPGIRLAYIRETKNYGNNIFGSTMESLTVEQLWETCKTWTSVEFGFYESYEVPHSWTEDSSAHAPRKPFHRRVRRLLFRTAEVTHAILSLTHFGALWREEGKDVHSNGNFALIVLLVVDFLIMYCMCKYLAKNDEMNYLFAPLFMISSPPMLFTQFHSILLPYYTFRFVQLAVMASLLVWRNGATHLLNRLLRDTIFAYALLGSTVLLLLLLPFEVVCDQKRGESSSWKPLKQEPDDTILETVIDSPRAETGDTILETAMENDDGVLVRLLARVQEVENPEKLLKVAHQQKSAKAFEAFSQVKRRQDKLLLGHRSGVSAVSISGDGSRLVSGGNDGVCILWDLSTSKPFREWTHHVGNLYFVIFNSSGSYVLTGGDDGIARIYDVTSSDGICFEINVESRTLFEGAFFPEEEQAATPKKFLVRAHSVVKVFDTRQSQMLYFLDVAGALESHSHIVMTSDGSLLAGFATYPPEGMVKLSIWDASSGEEVKKLDLAEFEKCPAICLLAQSTVVLLEDSGSKCQLLDLVTEAITSTIELPFTFSQLYIHYLSAMPFGDGGVMMTYSDAKLRCSYMGKSKIKDCIALDLHGDIWCAAASVIEGKLCVAGAFDDGSLRIWEVQGMI